MDDSLQQRPVLIPIGEGDQLRWTEPGDVLVPLHGAEEGMRSLSFVRGGELGGVTTFEVFEQVQSWMTFDDGQRGRQSDGEKGATFSAFGTEVLSFDELHGLCVLPPKLDAFVVPVAMRTNGVDGAPMRPAARVSARDDVVQLQALKGRDGGRGWGRIARADVVNALDVAGEVRRPVALVEAVRADMGGSVLDAHRDLAELADDHPQPLVDDEVHSLKAGVDDELGW